MDTGRAQLGDLVRTARVGRGYRSQAAFAEAAHFSPRSIAAAERGERVGKKVLDAIERTLGWSPGACNDFLRNGTLPVSRSEPEPDTPEAVPAPELVRHEFSADARVGVLKLSMEEVFAFYRVMAARSSPRAALRWLHAAVQLKFEAEFVAEIRHGSFDST